MKTVSKIVFIFFITMLSCTKKRDLTSDVKNQFKDVPIAFINFHADSVFYKLSVGSQNNEYYQDADSNLFFLVTREIEVLDKNFGGSQKVDFSKAIEYFIDNKDKFNKQTAYEVSKINIKKKDGTYENIWQYKNPIQIDDNGNYSLFELKMSLEDSYAEYNGEIQSRLHINFKTVDYDNGYKLYTLNYIFDDNLWKLVSRERVCTIPNDINSEKIGYCRDTINDNCVTKAIKFELTNDYIQRFSHEICN